MTDNIRWPQNVKIVTQIYLDANILKRQEKEDRFQWTTSRNWPMANRLGHVIDDVTWPRKVGAKHWQVGYIENVMTLDRLRDRTNIILLYKSLSNTFVIRRRSKYFTTDIKRETLFQQYLSTNYVENSYRITSTKPLVQITTPARLVYRAGQHSSIVIFQLVGRGQNDSIGIYSDEKFGCFSQNHRITHLSNTTECPTRIVQLPATAAIE